MLYELLIRGREDGTFAAHVVDYVDDGTDAAGKPRRTIGAPRPVAVADVGALIGAESARMLAALAEAETATARAQTERDTVIRQRDTAIRERDEARAALAEMQAEAAPPPALISRPQCAAELFARGMITADEMVAMASTAMPPALIDTVFAAMPAAEVPFARAKFAEMQYRRDDPLLAAVLKAVGADDAATDAFFKAAAAR